MKEYVVCGDVHLDACGRGRIYESILETIGNTPLVRASRICGAEGIDATILLKLESFNPLASVKDRIGLNMILALEEQGVIRRGTTLIEPTSGNTGISLAFVCAVRGYPLILTMPASMSLERRKMMAILGAELELTPPELGVAGAIARAEEILYERPNACIPSQFANPANPEIHRRTTANEIWNDTQGAVDVIVSGIGTGGTFTGIAQSLKPRNPNLKMVAVEPSGSQVLSGGKHGQHNIQGIGAGFVPDVMDTSLIDEIIAVSNDQAMETARKLAKIEGIPAGISSGAALFAALQIGRRPEMASKSIVVIIPDFAERYVSTTLFDSAWVGEK